MLLKRKRIIIAVVLALFLAMLVMCQAGVKKHQHAMSVADEFALSSAFDVKEYIEKNSTCPDAPEGWSDHRVDHDNRPYVTKGAVGGWFKVLYSCKPDLKFYIAVYYSMDSDIFFRGQGSSNIEASFGHFTDRRRLDIQERRQISGSIKQIYEHRRGP